ncbi:GAF domain-containing protein [Halalkalicoccus ordinarius]|uniref:GAF domain-containing protein n=1 Tax=Halalkalicoccus ordinarius TaxID=3116651 RepID=UPI00300F3C19
MSSAPSPSAVLEVFYGIDPPGTPLTTPEVAAEFDCTPRTIYNKLDTLVDDGALETKKVGARGRVWWRPPTEPLHDADGDADWTSEGERREAEARASESTFRQLFDNVPGCYLIVEPDEYEIVAVNDAYLDATMTERDEILGRTLFEVFPTDPDDPDPKGAPRLRTSLERVKTEGEADAMPVTHYPIPDRDSDEGEFVDRWWSPSNSPVFSATGEIDYIVHRVEDVTPVVEQMQADDEGDPLQDRAIGESRLTTDIILRGRQLHRAKERAYTEVRERERKLTAELAATRELQEISTRLIQEEDVDALYDEILDAVVTVMDADFARLQLRDSDQGGLRLLADAGFEETTPLWERVTPESNGPCSVALETDRRVVVSDVETCEFMAGTEDRETLLETGIRAVQSTPLVSRSGEVIGMLSTHWKTPHEPSERDLRLLDVLARQATDLINNRQSEEALRESEERYRELFESMTEGFCVIERVDADPDEPVDFRYVEANPAFEDHTGIGDVVGKTIGDVIPEEASDWIEIYDTVAQTGETKRFERELVSQGRILELHAFRVGDPTNRRVGVVFRDITDRKQRTRALEETHDQLRAATSAGSVGLWTWNVREDVVTVDEYVAESYGMDPETIATGVSIEELFGRVHEDDCERLRERVERAVERAGELDTEYRVRNADGDVMWLVLRGEVRCDEDGEALRMYGAISDITERKRAEEALKRTNEALERLTDASRGLMEASTDEISDRAAELTGTVLDVDYAALWCYDGATGEFRRHADQDRDETIGTPDRAWQAFIDDEILVENDVRSHETAPENEGEGERTSTEPASPLRSRVLVPLGEYGVLCAGSTRRGAFDERRVDLVETLAATLETAWDRATSEQRLARQNEELARLDRLNGLIRRIDEALVEADSVASIDRAVCDRLAESDRYAFAWIGERDPASETIRPREWTGIDGGFVDELAIPIDGDTADRNPVAAAARTRETQVIPDVATETRFGPLRGATLERGARSCIAVPLVYDGSLHGVLTVYPDRPRPDERDHAVLSELGRTIAHAIDAVETLHTDRVVELTLGARKSNTPLCRLARETGATIEFEGFVHQADREPDVFFTASGPPTEELRAAGERSNAIAELRPITDRADETLFRARSTERTLVARIVERNAVVRSLAIEDGEATAVVDVPHAANVREFVERLQRDVSGVELLARHARDRSIETRGTFRTIYEERLTEKQLAALRTAYFSGFFESPRVSTGREVAASLDVAQPTFTEHLRAAQRKLYGILFEDDPPGAPDRDGRTHPRS